MQDAYDEVAPGVWTWLLAWYSLQCDGEWEQLWGIHIDTLDNPGSGSTRSIWRTLASPSLDMSHSEVHRSEHDWCFTRIEGEVFSGYCGPLNLGEALHEFRKWVEASQDR